MLNVWEKMPRRPLMICPIVPVKACSTLKITLSISRRRLSGIIILCNQRKVLQNCMYLSGVSGNGIHQYVQLTPENRNEISTHQGKTYDQQ